MVLRPDPAFNTPAIFIQWHKNNTHQQWSKSRSKECVRILYSFVNVWLWNTKWSTDKINWNGKETHIKVCRAHVMMLSKFYIYFASLISKPSVSAVKSWPMKQEDRIVQNDTVICWHVIYESFYLLPQKQVPFLEKYPI